MDLVKIAHEVGELVTEKRRQYGDTATKAAAIIEILYPDGIAPHQFGDVLLMVRVIDKLGRISQRDAQGRDKGGESPWEDIAGYALIAFAKDKAKRANAITLVKEVPR